MFSGFLLQYGHHNNFGGMLSGEGIGASELGVT